MSQYQGDGNLPLMHAFKLEALPRQQGITCEPASGARFPIGTTTVSCTATDTGGQSDRRGTFTVTVTLIDTTAPVVTVPANATVEATSATGASFTFSATATDLVDGSVAASCTPASGATFPLGADDGHAARRPTRTATAERRPSR